MSENKGYHGFAADILCQLFPGFNKNEKLCYYVSSGTPKAIAYYLQREMFDKRDEDKVSLDIPGKKGTLFTFSLCVNRRGDSLSFVPEFAIGDEGVNVLNEDDLDDYFDTDYLEAMALKLGKNSDFMDCVAHAFKCDVCTDSVWEKSKDAVKDTSSAKGIAFRDNHKGNSYPDYSVAVSAALVAIIKTLAEYKDPVNESSWEIPSFGTFKIIPSKSGYNMTLVFDKEFKANTKCDKLVELMSSPD